MCEDKLLYYNYYRYINRVPHLRIDINLILVYHTFKKKKKETISYYFYELTAVSPTFSTVGKYFHEFSYTATPPPSIFFLDK